MEILTEYLKTLIAEHGIDIIHQEQRLNTMLEDQLPNEKLFCYLLELSLRAEIPKKLMDIQLESNDVRETKTKSLKHHFKEEYFLEDKAVEAIFECWDDILVRNNTDCDTVTDIDGNVYKTVRIGNQVWMAENLRVSRYRNGDSIPNIKQVKNQIDVKTGAVIKSAAWCNYQNNSKNDLIFGKLYNSSTIGESGLAPEGWHVPCQEDWDTLIDFLGGDFLAGGKLKESGVSNWLEPNKDATNESGFCALPGGMFEDMDHSFSFVGKRGYWWGTDEVYFSLDYEQGTVISEWWYPSRFFSVRCIKDVQRKYHVSKNEKLLDIINIENLTIEFAEVISGLNGLKVKFQLKTSFAYLKLSEHSSLKKGDVFDFENARVLTLSEKGFNDIIRVIEEQK